MKMFPPRVVRLLFAFVLLCGIVPGAVCTSALAAEAGWKVGDKIEVKWAEKWYPAAILEVKDARYKIHYDGFGSNWDEWVGADRIRENVAPVAPVLADDKWKVGDKVEAWNGTWFAAEIMVIGTGEHLGYYKVHYTGSSGASDQWLKADSVRASKVATQPNTAGGPRLGVYRIQSYGAVGNPPLPLGEVELLAGGRYLVRLHGGKAAGEGTWAFDAATTSVKWLTGTYKENGWGGGFEISREGKTHTLRMRRGTIATNSTD